jgi:hypothetical protein
MKLKRLTKIEELSEKLEMITKTNKRLQYQNKCIRMKNRELWEEIKSLKEKLWLRKAGTMFQALFHIGKKIFENAESF